MDGYDDAAIAARVQGYSWDEIEDHAQPQTDPTPIRADAEKAAQLNQNGEDHPAVAATEGQMAEPKGEPTPGQTFQVNDETRQAYAKALTNGSAAGPDDFAAHRIAGTSDALDWLYNQDQSSAPPMDPGHSEQARQDLAGQLVKPQDFTDAAIAITHLAGGNVNPDEVAVTRQNLIDRYAETGKTPQQYLTDAEAPHPPIFGEEASNPLLMSLTTPPSAKPQEQVSSIMGNAWRLFKEPYKDAEDASAYFDPRNLLAGAFMGVLGAGSEAAAEAINWAHGKKPLTVGDSDAILRAVLDTTMLVGGDAASEIKPMVPKTSLADTITHVKTGVAPEAARIIMEHGSDILEPTIGPDGKAIPSEHTPEQMAGELATRTLMQHFRDIMVDEAGTLKWTPGKGYVFDEPPEVSFMRRRREADAVREAAGWAPGVEPGAAQAGLGLERPLQPTDVAIREQRQGAAPFKAGPEQGLGLERPIQPRDIRDAEARARMEAATGERGVSPKAQQGDLGMVRPVQPEEIRDAAARARMEAMPGVRGMPGAKQGSMFGFRTPEEFAAAVREAAGAGRQQIEDTIARVTGLSDRENKAGWAQLQQFIKDLDSAHLEEYQKEVTDAKAVGSFHLLGDGKSVLRQMSDFVEGRIADSPLSADHPMAGYLSTLRAAHQMLREEIESRAASQGFMTRYLKHLYKNTSKFDEAMGITPDAASRISVPDIHEGIAKGLIGRHDNPLEMVMAKTEAMREYLDRQRILEEGQAIGHVYYAFKPRQLGDVELKDGAYHPGAPVAYQAAEKGNVPRPEFGTKAFASPGWGKIYNRYYSGGFQEWGPKWGTAYEKARMISNASVGMKLALSSYHLAAITGETWVAGLGRIIGDISHGELGQAVNDLFGYGLVVPKILQGKRMENVYLRTAKNVTVDEENMAKALAEGGARVGGIGKEYRVGEIENIFSAIGNGRFWRNQGKMVSDVLHGPEGPGSETFAHRLAMALPRTGEFFAKEAGMALNSLMVPLFDKMIPRIKTAAASDEMASWMRNQGKTASPEMNRNAMRTILKSMDDRFGEMNQDRLYWNKTAKQIINLITVSVGWEYGTLRAFGTGAQTLATGKWDDTRARWMIAFPVMNYIQNSVMQYLKTGTMPWSGAESAFTKQFGLPQAMQGFLGYWTGGNIKGQPEIAMLPSYAKDAMQMAIHAASARNPMEAGSAVTSYLGQKANNWTQFLFGLATSKKVGPAGLEPITNMAPNAPHKWGLPPGWADWLKELYAPISASYEKARGSNLAWPEVGIMGIGARDVPLAIQDPARLAKIQKLSDLHTAQDQLGREIAHEKGLDEPDQEKLQELMSELQSVKQALSAGGHNASQGIVGPGDGRAPPPYQLPFGQTRTMSADSQGIVGGNSGAGRSYTPYARGRYYRGGSRRRR